MDPARPNEIEPADPFFLERADHAILDKISIATEGGDLQTHARRLRPVLMKLDGVKNVEVDPEEGRIIITYDARRTHPPDIHDAILKTRQSGQ